MFVCRVCGNNFDKENRRGRIPVFCSNDCARIDRELKYPRKTDRLAVCEICNITFERGAGGAAKICSHDCKKEKERLRALRARQQKKICVVCNAEFVTGRKASVACSPECQRERIRVYQKEKYLLMRESLPETKEIICKWCGDTLVVPYSLTGGRKFHDECKKQATRANNRKKSVKRQGAKTQETIVHEVIAERDGYICHLCNEPVDMTLPRRSHYGATLDHVIPIAKGGLDSEDNVKLAHWICNVRKSDKLGVLDA